jgi:hypothetical protein
MRFANPGLARMTSILRRSPDPIDMDEDGRLSDLLDRLAHDKPIIQRRRCYPSPWLVLQTCRGKKVNLKRKARERRLEDSEARILAVLQKKRGLKVAGITSEGMDVSKIQS